MHQFNTDLTGAMRWISELHDGLVAQFLENFHKLPSWGPKIDEQLARYVDGLGNWVRANDAWSFESERYFGRKGLDIQKSRHVTLLSKLTT